MNVLSMILMIALQSSPDAKAGAAVASVVREAPVPAKEPVKPVESEPPVKDQSQLPQNKDTAVVSTQANPEQGLEDEIQTLQELQDEIRGLLNASRREQPGQPGVAAAEAKPAKTETPAAQPTAAQPAAPPAQPAQKVEPLDPLAAADAYYRVGKYNEALSLYESYPAAEKEDARWVLFQRANCRRSLGQSNDAVALYQKLITEHPDTMWASEAEWWITTIQWKTNFREN